MTPDQLAALHAAASAAHNDIIRSHGWDETVEGFDALGKDDAYLRLISPATALALLADNNAKLARIAELERDAARYCALRRGQKWSVVNGIGDMLRAEDLDAAIDAAMQPLTCTCPSGDGSLRWPCPRHPPESA
ncbi:hypothetical protein ACPRNU_24025 [Chromobacterium vaccinii]|uniref:hypothetical protein n=1 Tax=Chromobacterium vaccinii TaxID=1108595 RepID=UPI003C736A2C